MFCVSEQHNEAERIARQLWTCKSLLPNFNLLETLLANHLSNYLSAVAELKGISVVKNYQEKACNFFVVLMIDF